MQQGGAAHCIQYSKGLMRENTTCTTNTNRSITSQLRNSAWRSCLRDYSSIKDSAKGVLCAHVQLRPQHSMRTWKQTQRPDAQHVKVSGVGSLTGLTNRSLLKWAAHRPSFHAHTQNDLSAGCLHQPGCQLHLSHHSSFILDGMLMFDEQTERCLHVVYCVCAAENDRPHREKKQKTEWVGVLNLDWLWQRAVMQVALWQGALDFSLAGDSVRHFRWSVSTMDRVPVSTAWPLGPHPDTQTQRKHWKG